ncbi:hypothetical protein R0I01_13920 [Bacillus pumilus]|nr:hypothetical protein R0I01_13920 [Bacillus pumilus]
MAETILLIIVIGFTHKPLSAGRGLKQINQPYEKEAEKQRSTAH